ncbi:MAG: NADH-quinone oxidoreductase subunit NuoB [Polyangiales bacterium]
MAVSLPLVDESRRNYEHPLYRSMLSAPGLAVGVAPIDALLEWGMTNSLWIFPLATSCCGIELMAAAASRVDLDRMGTIVRATPRQADVMVIAGTITVKMAPRVKSLWEQMPEPKWAIAMGSCAISGDFYRDLYSVVPGIDTVLPVDVYIPGCPPNPEALMHGLLRLQEKVKLRRRGTLVAREYPPETMNVTRPSVARLLDPARDPALSAQQEDSALHRSDDELEPGNRATGVEAPHARVSIAPCDTDSEALLRDRFGVTDFPKDASPIVAIERHVELAAHLRDLGFTQLVYVVASHFPEKTGAKAAPERFEVAYALRKPGPGTRVASWRLSLVPGTEVPVQVPTLVGVFAGADWQEREQQELLGVRFDGHPDPRRLLLPERWEGHPLRKDYAAHTSCAPWR